MKPLARAYALLRSRRLAIWLIAAFVIYAAAATITADKDSYGTPYANPVFIGISMALTLATAACAWERAVGAIRRWNASTRISPESLERLRQQPRILVPVETGASSDAVIERVAGGLRAQRLSVRVGGTRIIGSAYRVGLIGSPLFHWALVLLFVFVGLGQLTRSEGLIGVPVGSSRLDALESYGTVEEGPWHNPGFTGLTFAVPEMDLAHVVDGVDRGASPLVEVYDGPELVVSHQTYPNSPLRYRSLLIHANNYGLAGRFTLETGGQSVPVDVLYDFQEGSGNAPNSSALLLTRGTTDLEFSSSIALDAARSDWNWGMPQRPRIAWKLVEAGATTTGTVLPGESIALGEGQVLRLDGITYYARLSVVDDWSVTPIYILFVLAAIGLILALLLPPRVVWIMLVERDGQRFLHAMTRQSRGDRMFPDRVEEALRAAVTTEGGAT
ncbi:MAG: cytochrome c biogenesis protein ResB [Coriobacteriia bacterium]